MEGKNILGLIVTCVLGIIMIGSLLGPAISDYSEAKLTVENTGMPYTEAGGDHTILITADGMTYDGETIDITLFPGNFTGYTIVYGEQSFVRWSTNSGVLTAGAGLTLRQFNVTDNTITVALSDNSVTVTTTASTQTFTANDVLYHISPSGGDYVLALNPYVNDEQTVYAAGDTFYSGSGRPGTLRIWIVWTGELDTITVSASGFNGAAAYTDVEVTNTTATLTNINSNLYRYDSVVIDYTATATENEVDADYPLTATYTYFLAPAEVSYDNPAYMGSEYEGLLGAIVVIAIAGLLLLIVGAVVRRRD